MEKLTSAMKEIHEMETEATLRSNVIIERLYNFAQNEGLTIPKEICGEIENLNEIYTTLLGKRIAANDLLEIMKSAI